MPTASRLRLAWFSPMPPERSGIAACSAGLVTALGAGHDIDVFATEALTGSSGQVPYRRFSAHDFVWRHATRPYDLTVYQLGNSSSHEFLWPYLFRYPGLTVMHDVHLHHARAAALLRARRAPDYRAEFAANHPDDPPAAAELAVAGFDSFLYYLWPMTRLVAEASRLTVVHGARLAELLREQAPSAAVDAIRLGHGVPVPDDVERRCRALVRARYGVADTSILFGCFGGLSPDKRVSQILSALAALLPYAPTATLLLGGPAAPHYDLGVEIGNRGLADHVIVTGYLESEDDLTACIAACDATLNLRWPTARETSGPWLRALAAGKPTIVTDLMQLVDVPSLDPRTWVCRAPGRLPVTVAVDILDEDHSLRLAMRRLATDAALRRALGNAARAHWLREHSPDAMLADYERALERARSTPAPRRHLPPHLVNDGTRVLEGLLAPFGLPSPLSQTR